ncbi:unnamed protein product, partial [Prorocentrum cordatum]
HLLLLSGGHTAWTGAAIDNHREPAQTPSRCADPRGVPHMPAAPRAPRAPRGATCRPALRAQQTPAQSDGGPAVCGRAPSIAPHPFFHGAGGAGGIVFMSVVAVRTRARAAGTAPGTADESASRDVPSAGMFFFQTRQRNTPCKVVWTKVEDQQRPWAALAESLELAAAAPLETRRHERAAFQTEGAASRTARSGERHGPRQQRAARWTPCSPPCREEAADEEEGQTLLRRHGCHVP